MAIVTNCKDCKKMWTWGDGEEIICPTCKTIRDMSNKTILLRAELATIRKERNEALAMLRECEKTLRFESVKADGNGWYRAAIKLNDQAEKVTELIKQLESE